MDLAIYADERRRECGELSLDDRSITASEVGNDGRGRLLGRADMRDNARIDMHEIVEVRGDHIHRVKYSYFLVVDGEEIGGFERDPIHDPPEHRHCTHRHGHTAGGEPWPAVSFKEAAEQAWQWLSTHRPAA